MRQALIAQDAMTGSGIAQDGVFEIDGFVVDPAARMISGQGRQVSVSARAMTTLQVLAAAQGAVVSRADLMDAVWPDTYVCDDNLTQAVRELRRAFDDPRRRGGLIETVAKSGYRMAAPAPVSSRVPAQGDDAFDLIAYQLCLESRDVMARSGSGAVELSEALAREAAERAPRFAMAQADYAIAMVYKRLYREAGLPEWDEIGAFAERATVLQPAYAMGHAAVGFVHGAMGRFDAARAAFSQAISLGPEDAGVHYLCARTLFAGGDPRGALVIAERTAALAQDEYRALFLAARAARPLDTDRFQRNGRACLSRLKQRLKIDPGEPRALNALGSVYAILGKEDAARKAIAADQDLGSPLEFYNVVAHASLGDFDIAAAQLEDVIDRGWRHAQWFRQEPACRALAERYRLGPNARAIGLQ